MLVAFSLDGKNRAAVEYNKVADEFAQVSTKSAISAMYTNILEFLEARYKEPTSSELIHRYDKTARNLVFFNANDLTKAFGDILGNDVMTAKKYINCPFEIVTDVAPLHLATVDWRSEAPCDAYVLIEKKSGYCGFSSSSR